MAKRDAAFAFFYKHAGWSYKQGVETDQQGRARGARKLARAEAMARKGGIRFRWVEDDTPDLSWWMDETEQQQPHEVLGCIAERPCPRCGRPEVLASLWNIVDPSEEYRRVVEAELADEALANEPEGYQIEPWRVGP